MSTNMEEPQSGAGLGAAASSGGGGGVGAGAAELTDAAAQGDDEGQAAAGGQGGGGDTSGGKDAAAVARPLYDADAEQVLTFRTTKRVRLGGGVRNVQVTVRHTLQPLTDDLFVEYDRKRNVRVAAGEGGIDTKSSLLDASEYLYGALGGTHEPAEITVDAPVKMGVIQDGLLVTALVAPPVLTDDEVERLLTEGAFVEDGRNTVSLRCLFNSREVVTEHDLDAPSAEQQRRYSELVTRAKLVDAEQLGKRETQMPSRAKALGKLYDELLIEARGYAGLVPLHHKVEVISEHLSTEQERVEGN